MTWDDDVTPIANHPHAIERRSVLMPSFARLLDALMREAGEKGNAYAWREGNPHEEIHRQRLLINRHLTAHDNSRIVDTATGQQHMVIVAASSLRIADIEDIAKIGRKR